MAERRMACYRCVYHRFLRSSFCSRLVSKLIHNPERLVMKKKIIRFAGIFFAGALAACTALLLITLFTTKDGAVKLGTGKYLKISSAFSLPGYFIIRRASDEFQSKDAALNDAASASRFSIVSANDIDSIEFSPTKEVIRTSGSKDNWSATLKDYIGEYRINAAGNNGFLYLYARNGQLYGTIRFPGWGKGAVENLKNVRINAGTISFTRSAQTKVELDNLAVHTPFVQNYTGTYVHSGQSIKGSYVSLGAVKYWTAEKNK
jgi:hypothetical protein